jgi:hypothetical protein
LKKKRDAIHSAIDHRATRVQRGLFRNAFHHLDGPGLILRENVVIVGKSGVYRGVSGSEGNRLDGSAFLNQKGDRCVSQVIRIDSGKIGFLEDGTEDSFTYKRAESPYAEGTTPVRRCEQVASLG